MRWLVLLLAAAAALALPGAAWAQLPELPGIPEVPEVPELPEAPEVPEIPEAPTLPGILPGTTSPPPSPPASADGSDSGDSNDTGTSGRASGSSSSRETTSSRNAGPRTRFDRLPRRYEVLLERILRGDNVRANLRRLEQALASASPELRARMLRLVRREIASLERGRPTPEDRRRLERLRRVEELLERRPTGTAGVGAGPGGSVVDAASAWQGSAKAHGPATAAPGEQTAGVSPAGASSPNDEDADRGTRESGGLLPGLAPPDATLGLLVFILGLLLLAPAALAFALSALPSRALPEGRFRHTVKTSRSSLAFVGLVAAGAMMIVLLLGAVI